MQIEPGKRVRLKVHLAVVGGETIEDSMVEYIQGSGKMLPGLEVALEGLQQGTRKEGVLTAQQAFGNPALSPHKTMKRGEFPAEARLVAGERFAAKGLNGTDVVLSINAISEDGEDIDVQLLHPLSDKDISYDVEVLSVTDPAPPPMPAELLELDEG